jgi:uncharacterized surface anchored protein
MMPGCVVAVLLLGSVPGSAAAQAGAIRGTVVDAVTGRPIAGALVVLKETGRSTSAGERGQFAFAGLPAGDYRVESKMIGYSSGLDSISVGAEPVRLSIALTASPVVLDGIEVSSRVGAITTWLSARGFPQRGLEGKAVLHLDDAGVRQLSARNLDALLRRVPGVRVRRLADGGGEIRLDAASPDGGPCRVAIYLNGSQVELGQFTWSGPGIDQRAVRPMRFDDLLHFDQLDGIELYTGTASPVASEACGTLLLWSSSIRNSVDEPLTGIVRGTAVDDASGRPLAGVRVALRPGVAEATTDAEGRFEVPDLLPGDYELVATWPGATPWTGRITVKAYAVLSIELRMGAVGDEPI